MFGEFTLGEADEQMVGQRSERNVQARVAGGVGLDDGGVSIVGPGQVVLTLNIHAPPTLARVGESITRFTVSIDAAGVAATTARETQRKQAEDAVHKSWAVARRERSITSVAKATRGGLPPGMHVLDRLQREGRIAEDQYQSAIVQARGTSSDCMDALLQLGVISEGELLKRVASWYQTQFVSMEKLAKAEIAAGLLRMIPMQVAKRYGVFPVRFDRRMHSLMLVAKDLRSQDLEKQLQMMTQMRSIRLLAARPAAIDAMIEKHYRRNDHPFQELLRQKKSEPPMALQGGIGRLGGNPGVTGFDPLADLTDGGPVAPSPPREKPKTVPPPTFTIAAPEIEAGLKALNAAPPPVPRHESIPSIAPEQSIFVEGAQFLESVQVLVALLERDRGELRGHSARVARLCGKVGKRLALSPDDIFALELAGHLHDIGKTGTYHLTPVNVSRYEGHALQAQKTFMSPVRLFESAGIPPLTLEAIKHMFERFDGKGFPDQLNGKEIPMVARILGAVETYLDLTSHAKNPYRRKLNASGACDVLDGFSPQLFDPTIAGALRQVVAGDHLRQKLLAGRKCILVVDPDPEETALLDVRLGALGFEVLVARDVNEALKKLESNVDAVVSEIELGERDGFALLRSMRNKNKAQPVIFVTSRGDATTIEKGFELGCADFVVKPASPDVVAAKVRQILSKGPARGVSGSLSEMSLPDVIQILSNGRKTGRLIITSGGRSGEIIFGEGMIWDATYAGRKGEEALYALLGVVEGGFELDPSHKPQRRVIQDATESLLLEGMRRLDEAGR